MGGFFEDAIGESLDTFREPDTRGDYTLLPEGTRVLAKVENVEGKTNKNGEFYPFVTSKTIAVQVGLPEANYGHPKFFDRSRLTIPKPMAAYAGQPEETIAKKKKAWQILIRRTEALGLDPRTAQTMDSESAVADFYGQAEGNEVIIVVGIEPATMAEDGTTVKYPAKNVVKEYYTATPTAIQKYGFATQPVSF